MRVIFRSLAVPGHAKRDDGQELQGLLSLEAKVYSPGEPAAVGPSGRRPPTAGEWLRDANADGHVVLNPPSIIQGAVAVPIPAAVFRELPLDTEVVLEWKLARKP